MIASEAGFYVTGGTLQQDTPSYVERRADTDLYTALRQGEFCYVLTARQMGKSSLVVRTAARLREEGVAVVLLELTALGQNLTPEQWYDGLLGCIGQELELEEEVEQFWVEHARLSPLQRWLRALREVVLALRPGRVVICLDEIDAVRSLPFSTDEFFAAIRECYNRRSEDPAFNRLAFCLLGVASPSDLIQDSRTTPFNIGRRIELTDFTEAEALPLAAGLDPKDHGDTETRRDTEKGREGANHGSVRSSALLARVLYWTGGHPYLTQRLCQAVAETNAGNPPAKGQHPKATVDHLCQALFLSPGAREQDNNLLFVREQLLRSGGDPASLLTLYRQVRSGGTTAVWWSGVREDETNPLVTSLRLSGIVRLAEPRSVRPSGHPVIRSSVALRVRNRIYARVFDRAWVAANMPDAELRRQRAAFRKGLLRSAAIAAAVVAVIGALAVSAARERDRVSRLLYVADMNVAQQAVSEENTERALELLDEHRPGKRGGADLRGFEWRYLWRLCQEGALHTFHGNGGSVWDVAYSPDGRRLAGVSRDGTARLWNLATKKLEAEFPGPAILGGSVAFSPDGRLLAVGGLAVGDAVTLWDLSTRRKAATLPEAPVNRLVFSPDGRLLAVGGYDIVSPSVYTAKLWDLPRQQEVAAFEQPRQLWSTFSPDGKTLALARGGSTVEFWSVAAKRLVTRLRTPRDWAWRVAFSPDRRTLATLARDGTVRLWDLASQHVVATLNTLPAMEPRGPGHYETNRASMVFSPDGRKLAAAIAVSSDVTLWDPVRKTRMAILRGHKKGVYSLAFSRDGETLASASADGTVKLWSAAPAEGTALGKLKSGVPSVAFAPDGKTLAAGNDDGTVTVWNPASRREVASLPGHRGPVRSVAFSPDGRLLASAGNDRTVRLWRLSPPRSLGVLTGHKDQVSCVAFSPNGNSLATGSADGTVQLRDVATQRETITLNTGAGVVLALVFSPDGRSLALGTNEYSVKLWDLAAREEVASLLAHTSSVTAVTFSPDGQTLASGSADHSIQLWDVAARQARAALKGCKDRVRAVAFSPDGRSLASGSEDGTVRLWNVATGREAARLTGQQGAVSSVAFSPDGNALAAGSKEGGVRLWRAASFAEADAQELSASTPQPSVNWNPLMSDEVQRRLRAKMAK